MVEGPSALGRRVYRLQGLPSEGCCQNYGAFLGTLNIRCRTILGTQNGTIILTTTLLGLEVSDFTWCCIVSSYSNY